MTEKRMNLNPEPLKAVAVPKCRTCGMRAPWCKCGEANYVDSGAGRREPGEDFAYAVESEDEWL